MKIAILGGGVGAMTAAYWLTNRPQDGPAEEHEITVYQLGWRLGGKGAAGRNVEKGLRIEEHGLHIWMGFYANAFRMMRAVYEELDRPEWHPLSTWKKAFSPQNVTTLMQKQDDLWLEKEWAFTYPTHPGQPGDQTGFPTPCGYIGSLVNGIKDLIERFLGGYDHDGCAPHELPANHHAHLSALHAAVSEAAAHAGPRHAAGQPLPVDAVSHHHGILKLMLEGVQKLIGIGLDFGADCLGMYRLLLLADLGVAGTLGIIRDLCGTNDWTSIDDQEWSEWLHHNGLHEVTLQTPAIIAMYDLMFAFRAGRANDPKARNFAAGSGTCAALRIIFDYYESVFFHMQASMGETIFTPLYEVLKKRGVKFKFFHRLRDVIPSADGTTIEKLHVGVQATTKNGQDYVPLKNFKHIDYWPSKPWFDQLEQGEELQRLGIDLEDYDAPWPDVEDLWLEKGKDFDLVVFGLSVGAVHLVCKQLMEQKQSWLDMVQYVQVVETLAFQFWFDHNVADLGWRPALDGRNYGERAVLSTYIEPADTWADMSQLIIHEGWDVPVRNISYFCGVLPTGRKWSEVVELAREFVEQHTQPIWAKATSDGKFRYDWLVVNDPHPNLSDEERFLYQYFHVNHQPTERYVLSVAGSTKYRLDPAHPGYSNLVLAGDWVKNGLALGCVESAVLGGMKGVQRFCPGMVIVE